MNVAGLAREIVCNCGFASVLVVGGGISELLKALLVQGVDAFGYEVVGRANDEENLPEKRSLTGALGSGSFNSVIILWESDSSDVDAFLQLVMTFYHVPLTNLFLKVQFQSGEGKGGLPSARYLIETKCFELGLRKSPFYYRVNEYSSLQNETGILSIPLEKVPLSALEKFPLSTLVEERDLHMDMLRESGSRSDAHVFRYDLASKYIRPGDVVLDAACGLGYGSYLLSVLTKARFITGIDGSAGGIEYAKTNYLRSDILRFQEGYLPDCLNAFPDHSVDCVISFETLEHVDNPELLLAEFYRVLTPGGRIICSVPNDWSDESGEDPNPFHFHVYDLPKFKNQLSRFFDIEKIVEQTADRAKKAGSKCEWVKKPRSCNEINYSDPSLSFEAEWLIGVASKTPLQGKAVQYIEKMFSEEQVIVSGNALAFSRDYENPWLIKSLISMGVRTENPILRKNWATGVLAQSSKVSADYGAALCVLLYLSIDSVDLVAGSDVVMDAERYVRMSNFQNPTVMRWQVSLAYALAIKFLKHGDRSSAEMKFQKVLDFPIQNYSVTLFTKFAQAAYMLGILRLSSGDVSAAGLVWRSALDRLRREISNEWASSAVGVAPEFEYRESASVVLLMARLSSALANLQKSRCSPPIFYSEISADCAAQLELMHEKLNLAFDQIHAYEGRNFAAVDQIRNLEQLYANCIDNGRHNGQDHERYVAELTEGKQWLEGQWKSQLEIIALQEKRLSETARNIWVRLLVRLGLLEL